jgi:hypothetical protein
MNPLPLTASLLAAAVLLAACGVEPDATPPVASERSEVQTVPPEGAIPAPDAVPTDTAPTDAASTPAADLFMANITGLCGKAFAGRIVADTPAPGADDPFAGKALVMHVRDCSASEIRIPFHVGDDRSRTWVLTRTEEGLRLKHDHRHEDGSADAVTMYGGDIVDSGTATRQEFPVDQESQDLFRTEGLSASTTNVWAMEIQPGQVFAYELSRPGRLFRVEFDLTAPVEAPPAPWGSTTP